LTALALAAVPARADAPLDAVARVQNQIGMSAGSPAADRVLIFGEGLLDIPYVDGPFGEGPQGQYDRMPLYRFDEFDCTTFVETVTALSVSSTFDDFKTTINRLRYRDGNVAFVERNHFTDLDWIPNNIRAGFFRDATESIAPGQTAIARAEVDKRAWYAKLPASRIQIPGISDADRDVLLDELHAEGGRFTPEEAEVPYIPLTVLFGPRGDEIFSRIRSGSVINVVRPNWDLVKLIGTHMNISHQGFAVRKDGTLYFMEASAVLKKTTMVPMVEYLRGYLTSPTIKGINVLEIAR
jgi:hypothetical protein